MTNPIAINSVNGTASPSTASSSLHEHIQGLRRKESTALDAIRQPKILHPIENEDLRLLILENISQEAVRAFRAQGYHVDHYTKAFSEEELIEKIGSYHAIGIRSKTKITKRVLAAASKVSIASTLLPCRIADLSLLSSPFSSWLLAVSALGRTKWT